MINFQFHLLHICYATGYMEIQNNDIQLFISHFNFIIFYDVESGRHDAFLERLERK